MLQANWLRTTGRIHGGLALHVIINTELLTGDADRRDFLADENEHDRERHLLVDRERLVKYHE